ncbi:MAG TPA: radical SAM protein [Dehalococcoidia bacterium]|nr:radical SAM protein [Dehalococcoidia bacterium]
MKGTPYDFFIQFHLTERCNLKCRHCYQSGRVLEMNYREICRAIDNIKEAVQSWVTEYDMEMSPSFHFTGGEPLLRNELFLILDYVRGNGFSSALMSNGTLIDGDTARKIKETGVSDVQISLDGLEDTHDSLRGKGSSRRTLEGIRNLVAQGVDTNINLTVSRVNMEQVDELVHLAEELGVSAIAFSRLVPIGRGKGLSVQALTAEEVADFYNGLRKHKSNDRVTVTSRDPLAAIPDMEEEIPQTEMPIGGCAAGVFGVTITCDGTVMPCRRMDLPVGNIQKDSFRELWAESPVLWSLRKREKYHSGCNSCRYWSVCRGCRAIALAYARAIGEDDYLGPDPQCPYYQSA